MVVEDATPDDLEYWYCVITTNLWLWHAACTSPNISPCMYFSGHCMGQIGSCVRLADFSHTAHHSQTLMRFLMYQSMAGHHTNSQQRRLDRTIGWPSCAVYNTFSVLLSPRKTWNDQVRHYFELPLLIAERRARGKMKWLGLLSRKRTKGQIGLSG